MDFIYISTKLYVHIRPFVGYIENYLLTTFNLKVQKIQRNI